MDEAKPIHFGHQNIRDDQRWALLLNFLQRLIPLTGSDHKISLKLKRCPQQAQNIWDIFYNQEIAFLSFHSLILPLDTECCHRFKQASVTASVVLILFCQKDD